MDLNKKAQWHLDFNGGFIPILELPDGTMMNESAILMNFASDYAKKGQGLPLWPHEVAGEEDSAACMATARLRLAQTKFDPLLGPYWAALGSRFQDEEKMDALRNHLPKFEEWLTTNLNGNDFIHGANPGFVDIHCIVFFERLVIAEFTVNKFAFDSLDIKNNAPTMYAYVHRFRAHPHMKDNCIVIEHQDAQSRLQLAMPPGERKMLTIDGVLR